MRWFYPFLWSCLTIICSLLIAKMPTESFQRATNIEYYIDQHNSESADTIRNKTFTASNNKALATATDTLWLKIAIPKTIYSWSEDAVLFTGSNETAKAMHGFLELNNTLKDIGECRADFMAENCALSTLQYAFPLTRSDLASYYYLKITPASGGVSNEFYFMKKSYFNKVTIFLVSFISLSAGIYLIVALIALIIFRSFKDSSFLIYSLFYFNLFATTIINRGIWDAYKPTDMSFTGATLIFPVFTMTLFFDLLFIRSFFDLPKKNPRLNKVYVATMGFIIGVILLHFIPQMHPFTFSIVMPMLIFTMLLTGSTLISFLSQDRQWAEQIAIAWGVTISCFILWACYRQDVIEGFWFFGYLVIFGRTLEALILNMVIFRKLQKVALKVGFAQAQGEENKVTKTLLRSLSHDLSNTTQLVKVSAQIIQENATDKSILKNIDRILYAAQEQADIIENAKNNFLLRGKHILKLLPVDLTKSIHEVLEMYKIDIEKKNLKLSLNLSEEPLDIIAEKTSLTHHVLGNLIRNACKFSHVGQTIHLTIRLAQAEFVELIIKDEGVGIPQDILNQLFDEDSDIQQIGTEGETGTGSGLSIVRDFMTAYGGTLQITSQNNRGVEVTLRFNRFSKAVLDWA